MTRAYAQEIELSERGDETANLQADDAKLREEQVLADVQNRVTDLRDLKQAKSAILAGDTAKAQRYLARVGTNHPTLSEVITRYNTLVHFMNGDFLSAYNLVKSERLNLISSYEEICVLRIVNLMALGKKFEDHYRLSPELENCRAITDRYTKNEHFWLTNIKKVAMGDLTRLPGKDINDFTSILYDADRTRLWLKFALYTSREKEILKYIPLLAEESFQNSSIRELLGIAYYRAGNPDRALDFIEDLSSPNADNIRGDISLKKREWEIAYGHFRLALKRKDDSLNALERAIPLAWLLGMWEDALGLVARYVGDDYDPIKLLTLETAIRIRLNEFEKADGSLRYLSEKLIGAEPIDIQIMKSYVALMRGDLASLKENSTLACRNFDGLNCWIADQLQVWDDITKTVKRTDEINNAAISPDQMLEESGNDIVKLKEKVFIDQRDIEELDSRMVKLGAPTL